jgi:hypothetical protein
MGAGMSAGSEHTLLQVLFRHEADTVTCVFGR